MQGGWVGGEQTAVLGREPDGCFVLNPGGDGTTQAASKGPMSLIFLFLCFFAFCFIVCDNYISKHPSIKGPM